MLNLAGVRAVDYLPNLLILILSEGWTYCNVCQMIVQPLYAAAPSFEVAGSDIPKSTCVVMVQCKGFAALK